MNTHRFRSIQISIAFLLLGTAVWPQADDGQVLRRYGLFIGANDGGAARARLEYAESDSRAMVRVMQEIGGMSASDAVVLVNPDAGRVRRELLAMSDRITRERAASRRVEFLFYYSGHSDEQSLLLGGSAMGYGELRDAVRGLNADVAIAILDSCASGAFTRLKGGQRTAPFLVDESSEVQGQVYLTSSSEDEASQESDAIGGSFFTHSLVSALRGAADLSQDGKVTLHEAYQYAQADTLARTENTQAGPQHPSWYINLNGTGDLVLTDLRSTTAALAMSADLAGTVFIRDDRGNLVAEVRKLAALPLTLALPPGQYTVSMYTDSQTRESRVQLRDGARTALAPGDFKDSPRLVTRSRGDEGATEADTTAGDAGEETGWTRAGEDTARAAVRRLDPEGIAGFIAELGTEIQRRIWNGLESGLDSETEWTRADPESPEAAEAPVEPLVAGEPPIVALSVGLVPGLSFPSGDRARKVVSINALMGISWSILGAEASGIMNITSHDVLGAQVAGIGNVVSGRLGGVQSAGVFNIVEGGAAGVQSAGVFNLGRAKGTLVQLAGVFNLSQSELAGGQFGGVFNLANGLAGMQAAGVFSVSQQDVRGAQLSGVFNYAQVLRGLQVAGVGNIAGRMRGLQIGVFNYGGDAAGVQIGVVNIAKSLRGLPIGLVNVIADGLILGSVSWDEKGFYGVELTSGTRLYTLLALEARFDEASVANAAGGRAGVGLHLPVGPFFLAGDIAARTVLGLATGGQVASEWIPFPSVRGRAGLLLFGRVGGFIGYTLDVDMNLGPWVPANPTVHTGANTPVTIGSHTFYLYPRFTAGISVGRQPD